VRPGALVSALAEGRAAVLWPNPAAIDFAALGEVREGEISIVVGDDEDPT